MISNVSHKSKKGAFLRRAALAGTALSVLAMAPALAGSLGGTSTWTVAAGSNTAGIAATSTTSTANAFTVSGVAANTANTQANIVITTGSSGLDVAAGTGLTVTATGSTAAASTPTGINALIVDNSGSASDIEGALTYATNLTGVGGGTNNLFIANANGITVGAAGVISVAPGGVTNTKASSIFLEGYNTSAPVSAFNGASLGGANGAGNITIVSGAVLAGATGTGSANVIVAGAGSINIGTLGSASAVAVNNGNFDVYAGLTDAGAVSSGISPASKAMVTLTGAIDTSSGAVNVYGSENVLTNSASNANGTFDIYAGQSISGGIPTSAANVTLSGVTIINNLEAAGTITSSGNVTADGIITAGGTFTNNGNLTMMTNLITVGGNGFVNATNAQALYQATAAGPLVITGQLANSGIFDIQGTSGGFNTSDTLVVNNNVNNSGLLRSVASNFSLAPQPAAITQTVANPDSGLSIYVQPVGAATDQLSFVNTGTMNIAGYGTTATGVVNPNLFVLAGNINFAGLVQAYDSAANSAASTYAQSSNANFAELALAATNGLSTTYSNNPGTSEMSTSGQLVLNAISGTTGLNTGVIDVNTTNQINVTANANSGTNPGFGITGGAVRFLSGGLVDGGSVLTQGATTQTNDDFIITGSNNTLQDPFTGANLHYALSVFPGISVTAGTNDLLVDTQVDMTSSASAIGNNNTQNGSGNNFIYTYGNVNDVGTLGSTGGNATFVIGSINATNNALLNSSSGIEVGYGETLTFDFSGNINNPQGPAENNSTWLYNYMPVNIGSTPQNQTASANIVFNPLGAAGNSSSNPYQAPSSSSLKPMLKALAAQPLYNNYLGPYGMLTPGGTGYDNNTFNPLAPQLVNVMVNGNATVYTGVTGSAATSSTNWSNDPVYGANPNPAYNSHLVVQATGNLVMGGQSAVAGPGVAAIAGTDVANYTTITPATIVSQAGSMTEYWPGVVYLRNAGAASGAGVTTISASGLIALNANLDNATYTILPSANGGNGITFASNNLVNLNYNFIGLAQNGTLTVTSSALSNTLSTDFGQYILQASQSSTPGSVVLNQAAATAYATGSNL